MIELIKNKTKFDFVGKFKIATIISSLLVVTSLVLLFTSLKYGVDFSGGAEIQAKFNNKVPITDLRLNLKNSGFNGVIVQSIGEPKENEILIKVIADATNLGKVAEKIEQVLKKSYKNVDIRKVDIVGPKAGEHLRVSGFQAMAWALIAIMIYVGLRFEFKFAPGAIIALFHDVSIIVGIFALFKIEFTLQTVAALLAIIGYSVNDTVIVYDRVREHATKYAGISLKEHINNAINETLSRTLLTSGTTLFVSAIMYFFGGLAIQDFFLAITLGVIIGTYSSIFVASPITLFLERFTSNNNA